MTRKEFIYQSAAAALLPTAALTMTETDPASALQLWYDAPATHAMNEALPIGNGRLGAVFFGGTAFERLVFNEDSLWTGEANPSGEYDSMGAYQVFGEVQIDLPGHENVTEYRRGLDLENAVGDVQYAVNGVRHKREYLASAPDQVLAVQLRADKPGSLSGTVRLKSAHGDTVTATGNESSFRGALDNGMRYEARLLVLSEKGTVAPDTSGVITFTKCDSVTVLLVAGTDYVMRHATGYRGDDPRKRLTTALSSASKKRYAALRKAHIAEYEMHFRRAALHLGETAKD